MQGWCGRAGPDHCQQHDQVYRARLRKLIRLSASKPPRLLEHEALRVSVLARHRPFGKKEFNYPERIVVLRPALAEGDIGSGSRRSRSGDQLLHGIALAATFESSTRASE
jgi:hypothetical protein